MRQLSQKSDKTYIYQSTTTLSAWIKWVIVGYVLIFSTGILFNIFYHLPVITKVRDMAKDAMQNTQNAGQYEEALFTQSIQSFEKLEPISTLSIIASLFIFILSAILIGIWINRSHKNARALGVTDIEASPAWAVGSFFVPIITLFVPYQAMKQLVNRSLDTVNQIAPSWILPIWWGTWLLDNIFNRVASRMADKIDIQATSSDTIWTQLHTMMNNTITTIWLENLAGILGIISAILLLRIIQMVNRAHQQLYEMKDDLNHESQSN